MPPGSAEVLAIERAAFDAWPAAEVASLGSWRLRFNHGVTRRACSVWPAPGESALPVGARVDAVERFYAERGAAASFQMTPIAAPPELDALLAARGYEASDRVSVEVGDAAAAVRAAPAGVEASCGEALTDDWFELSGRRGRFAGEAVPVYRALLGRLAGSAGFALARAGGEPAAVGLCVAAPPWAGVFSMLTLPALRRQGLGGAVLGALARWARARGAARLYLQVDADNAPARSLYARAGFAPRYEYFYRSQPTPRGGASR